MSGKVHFTCARCGDPFWKYRSDVTKGVKHCSWACRVGSPKGDKDARRLAYRLDLIRVARKCGRPDGVSPSRDEYAEHGNYGWMRCQGFICGFRRRKGARIPVAGWPEAMRGFGLTSPEEHYRRPNRRDVIGDVMRVAAVIGQPRKMPPFKVYLARGNYSPGTVKRAVERERWNECATVLGLEPRRRHASRESWVKGEKRKNQQQERAA